MLFNFEIVLCLYISQPEKWNLYIGMTNNLLRRIYEHKKKLIKGFTEKYGVDILVYFEETNEAAVAIIREKQLKRWKRNWKIELIESINPEWKDLYYEYGGSDNLFDEYFEELKKSGFLLSQE
jgi:putative endonuclease